MSAACLFTKSASRVANARALATGDKYGHCKVLLHDDYGIWSCFWVFCTIREMGGSYLGIINTGLHGRLEHHCSGSALDCDLVCLFWFLYARRHGCASLVVVVVVVVESGSWHQSRRDWARSALRSLLGQGPMGTRCPGVLPLFTSGFLYGAVLSVSSSLRQVRVSAGSCFQSILAPSS